MSKEKDLTEYGYRGDEELTLKVHQFYAMKQAIEKAVENGLIKKFPALYSWVDEEGNVKKKLTEKQKESGKFSRMLDIDRTSHESNYKVDFDENLFPEIMSARSIIQDIHAKAVEDGIAVHRDTLKKEHDEAKEKAISQESSDSNLSKV